VKEGERMGRYIALFRGINVGGNNLLPMKELKALLEDMALNEVKTYIQSGNVVFRSEENDAGLLAGRIGAEIEDRRGFEPLVLLLQTEELERAMESNPFPEAEPEPKTLHLNFLLSIPENPDLGALEELKTANERFELKGRVFYLHAPNGIGRSKLVASLEKLLGVPATGRNWRTVCKIMEIAKEGA
jgi:uncharacterized protein (DUF1697 family)